MIYTANKNALDESVGRSLLLMMVTTAEGHTNLQGITDTSTSKMELMRWEEKHGYYLPSATFHKAQMLNLSACPVSLDTSGLYKVVVDKNGNIALNPDGCVLVDEVIENPSQNKIYLGIDDGKVVCGRLKTQDYHVTFQNKDGDHTHFSYDFYEGDDAPLDRKNNYIRGTTEISDDTNILGKLDINSRIATTDNGGLLMNFNGVDKFNVSANTIYLDSVNGHAYFDGNVVCSKFSMNAGTLSRIATTAFAALLLNFTGVDEGNLTANKIYLDGLYGHAHFKGNVTYNGQLFGPQYGTTGKYVSIQFSNGSLAMHYLGVNPSTPLQAKIYLDSSYGNGHFTGALHSGGDGHFTGTVYSGGTPVTSDDRYKINERPITDAMQTLANLQFYEYDKVRDPTDTEGYKVERGVIAQQLESGPLSFAVDHSRPEKLAVNYQDINITTAQALKDLMAQVQTLQDRVAALEANFPTT